MAISLRDVPRDNRDLMRYVQPIIWSWMGVAGKGAPLRQTTVSSSVQYAGDFANAGAGGLALRAVGGSTTFAVTAAGITATGIITGTNFPIGEIRYLAGSTVPTGFLAANGAAVSRETYALLFTAIGTVWGVGDNFTTFNVPDLRGRVLLGVSASHPIGSYGGAESVSGPAHTHPQDHSHGMAHTHNHDHALDDHDHTAGDYHYNSDDTGGPSSQTDDLKTVSPEEADAASKTHSHSIPGQTILGESGSAHKVSGGADFNSTGSRSTASSASSTDPDSNVGAASYTATIATMMPFGSVTPVIWAGV